MDIRKHYNLLIEKRKKNMPSGYCETHHIVPRCVGGTDAPHNLVKLTPREHFVAHWMLTKLYTHRKIVYAFFCMLRDPHGHRAFNSHYYDRAKKTYIELQRTQFQNDNPMWRDHVKQKISESKKGSKNPNYGCGANNNKAYPVTVCFKDGSCVNFTHGKAAYQALGMSRSTWIVGIGGGGFHSRWNIEKVIKNS